MTQDQLARVLMPVGSLTKDEVRAAAREAGLPVADRPESQDVCFVPDGDIAGFIATRLPSALEPGPIEDLDGRVLGEHRGIARFTVGQRSGLGLARPRPTYVVRIDARRNALVVGDDDDLYSATLIADGLSWVAGESPTGEFRTRAKVRYAADPAPAAVAVDGDEARVSFDEPQRALAPGQAVVFYDGDRVLGGGTITS
jgi:tRNA-specific 2-thiouridylase